MKSYEVTIMYTSYATYFIEANTEEEAEALAWGKYDPDDADNCSGSELYSLEEVDEA